MGLEMWINKVNVKTDDVEHINEIISYNHYKNKDIPTPEEVQAYIEKKGWTKEKDLDKIEEYKKTLREERYRYEGLIELYEEEDPGYENVISWAKNYLLNAVMEDWCRKVVGEEIKLNGLKIILKKEDIKKIVQRYREKLSRYDIKEENVKRAIMPFKKILEETNFEEETLYYSSWW